MERFLFDTHVHTAEVSRCARVSAQDVVKLYKQAGYSGIVITDHMSLQTFKKVENLPWKKQVDHFLSGYNNAKKLESESFSVLFGMEIKFLDSENDYLVYGFNEDFLYSDPELNHYPSLKAFRPVVKKNNLIVFQAHPFRTGMTVSDYHLLDGIETYNGHASHNSNNDIALRWANKYGLRKLSGSDFHEFFALRPGGIYLDSQIKTNFDFADALHNSNYRLR